MQKKIKIALAGLLATSITLASIFSVVSCSSNTTKSTSTNSSSSNNTNNTVTNENGALPIGSNIKNGNLTNLEASWNNETTNGAVTLSSNYVLSLDTNAPTGSKFTWYITNNSSAIVKNNATELDTTLTSSITIPLNFQKLLSTHTYYVFVLISSTNATYPVQTKTVALNSPSTSGYSISISDVTNSNLHPGVICENDTLHITLNQYVDLQSIVPLTKQQINDNETYDSLYYTTYTWYANTSSGVGPIQISFTSGYGDGSKAPSQTSNSNGGQANNVGVYQAGGVGYESVYCTIEVFELSTDDVVYSDTTNTVNFFVSPYAVLGISNPNLDNDNVLVLNSLGNQSATLTSTLTNNYMGDSLSYQWYVQSAQDLNDTGNNYWEPISNGTSSDYVISDVLPTYNANYKLVVSSKSGEYVQSNIIHVYYASTLGKITLSYGNSATNNNVYIATNGQNLVLSTDTSNLNQALQDKLSYQWQELQNGLWTNLSGETSTTYNFTESNNQIIQIRLKAWLANNYSVLPIYTNVLTIQTTPLASNTLSKIGSLATTWFNNKTNLQNAFYSFFKNNSTYYDWFATSLTGGYHDGGALETKVNDSYEWISASDFYTYFQFSGVTITGTPSLNAADISQNPHLQFDFSVINDNTYLAANGHMLQIPVGTTVIFNTLFYLQNMDAVGSTISTMPTLNVLDNGSVVYSFSNPGFSNATVQQQTSWYWQDPWGISFSQSFLSELRNTGYFSAAYHNHYISDNYMTFLWLNSIGSNPNGVFDLNASTVANLPDFLSEATSTNTQILSNMYPMTSIAKPYAFTNSQITLNPNPYLSNNATVTFSYAWYEQKVTNWNEIGSDWTDLNNTSSTYSINYPTGLKDDYGVVYKCIITTTYNEKTIEATFYFYIEYTSQTSSKYQNKIPSVTSIINKNKGSINYEKK